MKGKQFHGPTHSICLFEYIPLIKEFKSSPNRKNCKAGKYRNLQKMFTSSKEGEKEQKLSFEKLIRGKQK